MKDRKKRTLVIGILCCLLVFMGVGFAVMNATLNINGTATAINTWDVRMTNIEVIEKSDGATNEEETKINEDGVTAIFNTDFTKPGDFITYKVTIENKGSIDAVLNDISVTLNVSEADKDLFNITDTRPNNQLLEAGTSTTFTIKVEFRSDADRMPSGDIEYIVKVDYSQQTGEIIGGEEDWTFKVDESGTIVAYNYEKGTDVVVPAEVDGIPVKTINEYSFLQNNVSMYVTESEFIYIVIDEQEPNLTYVKNKLIQGMGGCSLDDEECLSGLNSIVNICTSKDSCYDFDGNFTGAVPVDATLDGMVGIKLDPNLSFEESVIDGHMLTTLDLSDAIYLEEISNRAFSKGAKEQNKLEVVVFPQNGVLKTIGDYAFYENSLGVVEIPASVETIGSHAFHHDSDSNSTQFIEALTFGENSKLNSIGNSAFYNNKISSLALPDNLKIISERAFCYNQIVNLVIPGNVTTIEVDAFTYQNYLIDSQLNKTLSSVMIKRTSDDFMNNVTVTEPWYDNSLNPTISYDPN